MIFVESTCAIACDADIGETLYKKACKVGVQIIPQDLPTMFEPEPYPVQNFQRHVTLAMVELEKNMIVQRLKDGRVWKQKDVEGKVHALPRSV